jgi:pilus assembly protein Flp/PilA
MTHHIFAKLGEQSRAFARILYNQRGVASVEFGLIAALIAVAAIQAMSSLGGSLADTFSTVDDAIVEDGSGAEPTTPMPDMP